MTAYASSQHLTPQQLFGALIGEITLSGERHMSVCESCSGEFTRLKVSLSLFGSAVHKWSDHTNAHELDWKPQVIAERDFMYRGGMYKGNAARAGFLSLAVHAAAVGALLLVGTLKPVQTMVKESVSLAFPDLRAYVAKQDRASGGGGGGGARQALDASKGNMPKPAPRQFVPPRVDPVEAKLQLPPSIVAPDDLPNAQAMNFGEPLSKLGAPSNGTGLAGIGPGLGGGIGPGNGPGFGPGSGGGFGGGVYRVGAGVSAPSILFRVEPEYSEEARKAKWQGTVVLALIVDAAGRAQNVRVLRSLGLGLDQKAMEAVSYWIFKPGFKDGKPVAVMATVEINFRLL